MGFSDERCAPSESARGPLYKDGRYASDAMAVAKVALARFDGGGAHLAMAKAFALMGDFAEAVRESCAAIDRLDGDPRQYETMESARSYASRLVGDKTWAAEVERVS